MSRAPALAPNPRIDELVLGLTEITQKTIKGPAFRHAAMRDYFVAGRIAREILDPSVRSDETDELMRSERWDSAKRDAVLSWLDEPSGKAPDRIRTRLRSRGDTRRSDINPMMRRNLLDLLLALDRATPLEDLDLTQIPGDGIDLKKVTLHEPKNSSEEAEATAEMGGTEHTPQAGAQPGGREWRVPASCAAQWMADGGWRMADCLAYSQC